MPPTETEIQEIAQQIAHIPDGRAKLDRLLRDERDRLDVEARRIERERKKLEDAEFAKEAARLAEAARAEAKAAREAEERARTVRADARARIVARAAEHAVALFDAAEQLRASSSWDEFGQFEVALTAYVADRCGHHLRRFEHGWTVGRYFAALFRAMGTPYPIEGAIARVRELDTKDIPELHREAARVRGEDKAPKDGAP